MSKPMTLRTLPPSGLEGEERFQLQLVHVSNGAVISASHGSATIIIQSDARLSGSIAVSPHSQVVVVGQLRDGYDGSEHVQLVRNGGKYGRVDVMWQILTSLDSDVFLQTEGIATFHDLETSTDVYIMVIKQHIQNVYAYRPFSRRTCIIWLHVDYLLPPVQGDFCKQVGRSRIQMQLIKLKVVSIKLSEN